jgi:hypothetical protein
LKYLLTFGLILGLLAGVSGQDTLRLESRPAVILKSWYPEYSEIPCLKIGEPTILFAIIPEFENTALRDNDINLLAIAGTVNIEETDKTNQYSVTVHKADSTYMTLEIWFNVGSTPILIHKNSNWVDIKQLYPFKDNSVMLQSIKLKVEK